MKTTIFVSMMVMIPAAIWQGVALAAAGLTPQAKAELAATSSGRIVLHVLCAFRDHKFQWHGRGVVRELALARA